MGLIGKDRKEGESLWCAAQWGMCNVGSVGAGKAIFVLNIANSRRFEVPDADFAVGCAREKATDGISALLSMLSTALGVPY